MITRTFRLPPEYDKILNKEATNHGLTVSALLNQIIRQYITVTRFTEKNPTLSISYRTFKLILESIPEKELAEVAEKTGSIIPEEDMLQYGKRLDFDSVNWYIDTIYGRYKNWFDTEQSARAVIVIARWQVFLSVIDRLLPNWFSEIHK